jgi:ribosomal protein S18 acetylase RimI-like enzyme
MMSSPPISLRSLHRRDPPAVHRLWADRFGGRPERIAAWIDAALNPQAQTTGHVAVPSREDRSSPIVGFGILEIAVRDYTLDYLGVNDLDLDPDLDLDVADTNGLLHMVCVDRDWEGRGIATMLYRRHLRLLRERNVRRAYGISWHRPQREGADSRVVFEKTGFHAVATVADFYARTSPRTNCPDCGGPCRCTASIYEKRLAAANAGPEP